MKLSIFLIFVLVFSVCGGDSPDDSVDAFCDAGCARKEACRTLNTDGTKASCFASCKAQGDTMAGKYKTGFLANLTECLPSLACDKSDDQCGMQAMAEINPNWTTDPELLACVQKAKTCNDSGSGFSDDYCQGFIYLNTATANKFRECLTLACGAIAACLRTL